MTDGITAWIEFGERTKSTRTVGNQGSVVSAFASGFGILGDPIGSVTMSQIDDFINDTTRPAKAGTRRSELACLRSFFKFCCQSHYILRDPTFGVIVRLDTLTHEQKETRPRRSFTPAQVLVLQNYATDFWRAAIAIGYHTGLRLGDICCLEWAPLATPGQLKVWMRKTGKSVVHCLSPELQSLVATLPRTDPVYAFPEERATYLHPTRHAGLSVQFSRLCAKCGLTGYTFHDLRSTFATEELARRQAEAEAMSAVSSTLGHSNSAVTGNYIVKQPAATRCDTSTIP